MDINIKDKEALEIINGIRGEIEKLENICAGELNNSKTCVIVVDMIEGFCNTGLLASDRNKKKIMPIAKMLKAIPNAKKIFIRDCHTKNATEFSFFPSHCAGDLESELVSELKGIDGSDVTKNSTNGFFNLIKSGFNIEEFSNIVIVGVCSDICVLQLAITLRAFINEQNQNNASVIVLTDLIETFDAPFHNGAFSNLSAYNLLKGAGVRLYRSIK